MGDKSQCVGNYTQSVVEAMNSVSNSCANEVREQLVDVLLENRDRYGRVDEVFGQLVL